MAGRDVTLGSTELLALPVQALVGPTRFRRRIVKPVLPAGPPELQPGNRHVQQPIRNRHVRESKPALSTSPSNLSPPPPPPNLEIESTVLKIVKIEFDRNWDRSSSRI